MPALSKTLVELKKKFWRSIVNQDTDSALEMLLEPTHRVSCTRRPRPIPKLRRNKAAIPHHSG